MASPPRAGSPAKRSCKQSLQATWHPFCQYNAPQCYEYVRTCDEPLAGSGAVCSFATLSVVEAYKQVVSVLMVCVKG